MILNSFWESLEGSAFSSAIASSEWMFPTIETLHVIAIVSVVGAIIIMDLRLLGLTSRNRLVTAIARDTLPLTWIAFACAVITGLLLFVSKATSYMINPYFLFKMGLLALAGLNMAFFHFVTWKTVAEWDGSVAVIPTAAKLAGLGSLIFWALIVLCGRIIGFTLGIYH
ncbi:MAG TPA: DUF6644 family protein [Sphingobium sp.]|nr:DUF6644 family protein [Sphingobium sp.]